MKLEVGMYVRYTVRNYQGDWTEIDKINEYIPKSGQLYLKNSVCVKTNVIKASHNKIDLIEVGDYVNGYKVSFKDNDYKPFVQCDYPVQKGTTNHYRFYEEAIYSIVTKEQFESMSYKVGE